MVIVGLSGSTAAGKSSLCLALSQLMPVTVIPCDDFYLPKEQCPRFDLEGLPWANGIVPLAFRNRGNADTNVPAAVDWERVLTAVTEANAASASSGEESTILVDGLLLFGDHPGAQHVLKQCDHCAVLWAEGESAKAALRSRKYTRGHLGKASYQQRGVTETEYQVYFDHYVWNRWETHGAKRVPPDALRLEHDVPTQSHVETLRATGWFPSPD